MANKGLKPLGIGLIVLLVIGGVCLFSVFGGLRTLLGGAASSLPNTGGSIDSPGAAAELGDLYSAVQVDELGCPLQETDQFYTGESVFVGLQESYIPRGAELFVRLSYEGAALEDTQPIVAGEDTQGCVWFEFGSTNGGLEPGDYQADLYVDGRRAGSLRFAVSTAAGAASGSGGAGNAFPGDSQVELGQVVMTAGVDQAGCPLNQVDAFYQDETVYLATTESYIPAGSEIFARLVESGGVPIEDTQPIVADQDMTTCFWFSFEGNGYGGLPAGDYTAEVYINSQFYDAVAFTVR